MDRDDGHDVLKERFGEHHKTTIEYYARGDKVEFNGYPAEEISPSHIARNRVKQIKVAVDSGEDLQTAYRFAYIKIKKRKTHLQRSITPKTTLHVISTRQKTTA